MLLVDRPWSVILAGVLLLALAPAPAVRAPTAPTPPEPPPTTTLEPNRVWLRPAHRQQVAAAVVDRVPDAAITFLDGQRSYFVEEGEGWFRSRPADEAPRPGERVVTQGAFVIKSELSR